MDSKKSGGTGHIITNLGLEKFILKYFGLRLDLRTEIFEFKKKIGESMGLADASRMRVLQEELDRLEGLLHKQMAEQKKRSK